jgi:hypothetical protein
MALKTLSISVFSYLERSWEAINVSDDAKDFITQLLTKDQDKRPSAE